MIDEDDDRPTPAPTNTATVLALVELSDKRLATDDLFVSPPAPDPVPEHDSPLAPPALPKCCGWCDLK